MSKGEIGVCWSAEPWLAYLLKLENVERVLDVVTAPDSTGRSLGFPETPNAKRRVGQANGSPTTDGSRCLHSSSCWKSSAFQPFDQSES